MKIARPRSRDTARYPEELSKNHDSVAMGCEAMPILPRLTLCQLKSLNRRTDLRTGGLEGDMFRLMLILLAGLPMLMPRSMCLCQILPPECARLASAQGDSDGTIAQGPSGAMTETGEERPVARCRCGHSYAATTKPGDADPGCQQAMEPVDCPSHMPCPHCHSCQQATSGPVERIPAPIFDAPSLLAPMVSFVGFRVSFPKAPFFGEGKSSSIHARPLYLSFCTFLI